MHNNNNVKVTSSCKPFPFFITGKTPSLSVREYIALYTTRTGVVHVECCKACSVRYWSHLSSYFISLLRPHFSGQSTPTP